MITNKKAMWEFRLGWIMMVFFFLAAMVYMVSGQIGLQVLTGKYLIWGFGILLVFVFVAYFARTLSSV